MGAENQVTTSATISCGACQTDNPATAKFCEGCGHSMLEPCVSCSSPVLLTQKFCIRCGADLEQALQAKHEQHQRLMIESVSSAKEHDFENALLLLENVAKIKDFRFAEAARNAIAATSKIKALQARAENSANNLLAQAKEAFDQGNHPKVVQLLEAIPPRLLYEDAKKILTKVKSHVEEIESLEKDVQTAIAEKRWTVVGGVISQLLVAVPDNPVYQRLAGQVTKRLIVEARELLSDGQYDRAADKLAAVPSACHMDEHTELRNAIESVRWLSKQVQSEPYASPMLGRIATRYSKDAPDDDGASEAVKELAATLKRSPRPPRMHLPIWRGSRQSWIGGDAGVLAFPTKLEAPDSPAWKFNAGRFNVAIGLALQGLGQARIQEQFLPKKSMLASFRARKNVTCWGLDVGTAAVKAVCLKKTDDGLKITDVFFKELDTPTCRRGLDVGHLSLVKPAVEAFLEDKDVSGSFLWSNFPASDLVTRFVRLPPVKDKQADQMLQVEISQRIPISADDLVVLSHRGVYEKENASGRPAMIAAARKSVVQRRIDFLESCGLKLDGLQADAMALANFAAFEFADLWAPKSAEEKVGTSDDAGAKPVLDAKAETDSEDDDTNESESESTPSVALLDCGASSTTLMIVSGETQWCWTVENGGEEITGSLARQCKITRAEAEQLKRNPAAIKQPSVDYGCVEERLEAIRLRVQSMVADAKKHNSRFEIASSWAMGGGSSTFQWLRNVMCQL